MKRGKTVAAYNRIDDLRVMPAGEISLALFDGYRRLALNVFVQAVLDASKGKKDAASWIMGDGLFFLDGAGIEYDLDLIEAWLASPGRVIPKYKRRRRVEREALGEHDQGWMQGS